MQNVRVRVALAAACVAFTLIYSVGAIFLTNKFLIDPDTFLHISLGKLILQNGHFPEVDQFSYTAFGKPWLATDWMSEIAFAALYKIGQWRGVTEIVALTSALISGVLCFYLTIKLRLSIAFGVTVIIVLLISPHFLARPVIFSYLLLSIWIVLILEIDDQDEWRGWRGFILIPVMLLWANVHASFTFGLAVFYLFLGSAIWDEYNNKKNFKNLRHLIVLIVGVTIATAVTPYGPSSALKIVKLMRDPALAYIDEWHPPEFQKDPIHLIPIVGLFALLAYLGIRLRGPRLLTLILVTVFALQHKRGLGLFALVAPLLLVRPFSEGVPWICIHDPEDDRVVRFANKHSGMIALTCTLIVAATSVTMWINGSAIEPPPVRAPAEAVAAATRAGLKGNVLNSYGFGGYLIFSGVPTFVDGRVELYENRFLQRYFNAMNLSNPDDAAGILKEYDVAWALLQPSEPIAFKLKTDGWVQVYADKSAIVLAKRP